MSEGTGSRRGEASMPTAASGAPPRRAAGGAEAAACPRPRISAATGSGLKRPARVAPRSGRARGVGQRERLRERRFGAAGPGRGGGMDRTRRSEGFDPRWVPLPSARHLLGRKYR